jgi:rare lipoprotein A
MSMRRLAGASLALSLLVLPTALPAADNTVVYRETGEASWYGPGFHGKKTASGERFDQHELTAAHPKLPLGSEAKVTNLQNGRSVTVEINDRGPYSGGRDIDLSKAAAERINAIDGGTAPVRIESTKSQIEQAIDSRSEARKVQAQLETAKDRAEAKEPRERRIVQNLLERQVASGG